MKVFFKNMIAGFTGKADNSVVYYHSGAGKFVVRQVPEMDLLPQNEEISKASNNLCRIDPSEAYKNDLRTYIRQYKHSRIKNKKSFISWNNPYLTMLYEMQRQLPGIDLKTLTRAEIYAQDLPCISVARAVEAGLLPPVAGYQGLVSQL